MNHLYLRRRLSWCPRYARHCFFIALLLMYAGQSGASQELLISIEVGPLLSGSNDYFKAVKSVELGDEGSNQRQEYVKSLLGGEGKYQRVMGSTLRMSADKLAEQYVRSFDGYISTVSTKTFLEGMEKSTGPLPHSKTLNALRLPDGQEILVPLYPAMMFHAWSMAEIGKIRSELPRSFDITGTYKAVFNGKCSFQNGNIDIYQDGFVFEGRRHEQLLFWGAVGSKLIFMQAAETKLANVYGPKENARVHFPHRVSDIYKATISENDLVFLGTVHKECRIRLKRP